MGIDSETRYGDNLHLVLLQLEKERSNHGINKPEDF